MERMPDRLVDQMDEHNAFICEAMCKAYHVPMVEQSVVHWMSHSQIDMFIFMVTHMDDEEEALRLRKRCKISAGRLVRTRQTVGCPHVLTEGREKKHRSSAFGQKV